MVNGLEPVYDKNSKILILGSLPSVKSIKKKEYYGNSTNQFWKILLGVFNEDIEFKTYSDKLSFLKRHHIALWDVIRNADRKGSLDSNIKNEEYNDLIGLINKTNIKYIFVNGTKAEKSLLKYMKNNNIYLDYSVLPSSSSANTRYTLKDKIKEWTIINK